MRNQLTTAIESCFAKYPSGGEFMLLDDTCPYKTFSTESASTDLIYGTKSHATQYLWPTVVGGSHLIARPGLPDPHSLKWAKEFIGERAVRFLGDLDPPDLRTYLWLRESLPDVQLTYAGISDTFLTSCGADVPDTYLIMLSPDEAEAYHSLKPLIESLAPEVGERCMAILARGQKMELEAVVSTLAAFE